MTPPCWPVCRASCAFTTAGSHPTSAPSAPRPERNDMLTNLAIRNLFRNRRRSAITLAVIVFGAVGLILFGGYKAITFRGLRESTIRRIGHLQLFKAGYAKAESQKPLEYGLENADAIRKEIERDPRVRTTAAQITLM